MDEQILEHFCVPNAFRDAWTWEIRTKRAARIAVTKISEGDGLYKIDKNHVQAEGQLPDGSWVPLTTHNADGGNLRTYTRHFPIEPYKYMTLDEFIEEQQMIRKAK